MEYDYILEIKRERGNLSGHITIQDKRIKSCNFSIKPDYFIPDLVDSLKTKVDVIDEDFIDSKVIWLSDIKRIFPNDLDLYDIEKMKIAFGIDLSYNVYCKRAIYKDRQSPKTFKWFRFIASFNKKKGLIELPAEHLYIYRGDSMASVILAIYHYLAFNGYKLTTCQHCGKAFFTQNLKNTLCERKTPYAYLVSGEEKKYSLKNKSCKEAVKTIRDRFRRRKTLLLMTYRDYDSALKNEKERAFDLGTWPHMEAIKKEPSVENLKKYEKYLYVDNLTDREKKNISIKT